MKNWKTTLLGAAGAALYAVGMYANNGGNLLDWKLILGAIITAAFGYVAKDAGVTGPAK